MANRQTSFVFDERTLKLLDELKQPFGVSSNVAVIRKALNLAKVATEHSSDDHAVTFRDSGSKKVTKVILG